MKKRILSFLLAFLTVVSIFPAQAFATDNANVTITPSEGVTEPPCITCGKYDCTSSHLTWCTECKKDDCGVDHTAIVDAQSCPTCSVKGCTNTHERWCATCGVDNCTNHTWCDICKTYTCTTDHGFAVSEGGPACNCPEGHDTTMGHVATCPLYTCLVCGKTDCYDNNCQQPAPTHPMVGKYVKLAASTMFGYVADPNWSYVIVGSYPAFMEISEVLEKDGVTYYRLKAAPNNSWPTAGGYSDDTVYLEAEKLVVVTWCDACKEYDCGEDHSQPPVEPENPCACCESCTGADGCECACGNCDFCEKEEEPSVPSISATVVDSNGNEQTVTVSGESLPEGAELVVSDAPALEIWADPRFEYYGFNISIVVNGTEWQPSGKLFLTFNGITLFDNPYIAIDHVLDDAEAIRRGEGIAFDDPEIVALFPTEEKLAFEVTGLSDVIYVETFSNEDGTVVIKSDGTVSVEIGSFSTYYILSGSSTTAHSNTADSRALPTECDAGSEPIWYIRESSSNQTFYFHGYTSSISYRKNWELRNNTANATIDLSDKNAFSNIYRYADVTIPSTAKAGTTVTVRAWATGYAGGITLQVYGKYTISYNANGGSGAPASQQAWPYDTSSNPTISTTVPTRTGYKFLGWVDANGKVWAGGTAYTGDTDLKLTAMWGKQSSATSGWNKNFYILPGTTSHNFTAALKYIDKDKISQDGSQNNITGDNNTYYIAPGATVALAHDSGMWRIDGAKTGLTLKAGSATANASSWTAAATDATLTVSATAAEGTTMMIYVRDAAAPAEVSCARIIVDKVSDITAAATNDTQGIYRLGIFVLGDSSKIPGEPNYTIDVSMISWNDGDGMAYKSSAKGLIEELIGTSAHYESSQDGSCTMGIVDYEGFETGEHMSDQLIKDAMSTLILAVEKGYNMIAADGTKLLEFYNQHGGGKAGADAIKANFSVRPYVVKLMTALPAVDLGWHVDLAVYAKNTVMVNYNLNIPQGYVVKTLGTPAPGIGQSLTGDASVKITEAITLDTPHTATVTGATDTVNLIFKGWNTKPDGTGTPYNPGSTISLSESITLYAQWDGGSFATGTLEIHKRVKVAANSQQPNANDTFTFSPGLEGSWSYAVYNATTGAQLRTGTMTNGIVTLEAGEFVRFTGVPIGSYTVEEINLPADYTPEDDSYTVDLKGGYVNQAIFTNIYEKTLTYTMTGVINHGTVSDPVTVDCGEEAKLSFTPHKGYEMTGWRVSTESEDQIFTTPDTNTWTYEIAELKHNVTVTVYTRPIKYSISYELNDGELAAGVTNPESYTIETETFTLNNPTRDGYKFKGWATSENATSGTETETIAKGTTGNKTYYAVWERSLVDLTITATTDDVNQNFIFTVSGTRSDGVEFKPIEVVLCSDNNFRVTIKDLPVGIYTVTENNDWSWRENPVDLQRKDLTTQSQTASFTFGAVDDLHWLSGYSYKRKKGDS